MGILRTAVAVAKIKRIQRIVANNKLKTRREARELARRLKAAVPVDTGRLKRAIRVQKRRKYWAVIIPRKRFPRFFYPIRFMALYRRVVRRYRPDAKLSVERRLKRRVRNA